MWVNSSWQVNKKSPKIMKVVSIWDGKKATLCITHHVVIFKSCAWMPHTTFNNKKLLKKHFLVLRQFGGGQILARWWLKKSHHFKKKQHFLSLSLRSLIFSNSNNLLPVYHPVVWRAAKPWQPTKYLSQWSVNTE